MAVAIRELGYTNVKIYNGGMREWLKAGLPVEVIDPIPEYTAAYHSTDELKKMLDEAEKTGCREADGTPRLTLLDLRTERAPEGSRSPLVIDTSCDTISGYLDDLQREDFRGRIPRTSPVVVVTETGNRDDYAASYLSKHGYTNVFGLRFGMRGWIKADYPTRYLSN